MKRLSQTWRQKSKATEKTSKHAVYISDATSSCASTDRHEGTPRRSQRLAKPKSLQNGVLQEITVPCNKQSANNKKNESTPNSSGHCSLFNSSFGFDFDADVLSAVDMMEREHMGEKKNPSLIPGISPIVPNVPQKYSLPLTSPCNKVVQSTPNESTSKKIVGHSKLMVEKGHMIAQVDTCVVVPCNGIKTSQSASGIQHVSSTNLLDGILSKQGRVNSETSKRKMCFTETSIGETSQKGMSTKQTSALQTVNLQINDKEKCNIETTNRQTTNKTSSRNNSSAEISIEELTSRKGMSTTQTSVKQTVNLQINDKEKHNIETTNMQTSNKENSKFDGEMSTYNNSESRSQVSLTQEQCELTSWGLPDTILGQYKKIGITTMFEWQAQCLRTGNVLNGGNLVYSAPTSAGKTMVAEILMLKRILETKCKALFILPFVSVAREKMFYLQRMFGEAGIKVDGYMGSQVPTKGFDSIDIAVCTIEKANGLVNRLMEAGQLQIVGAIIVDEMHLIGDTSRGYLLELLLTKVLYMSQSTADSPLERNVQVIGMSATLPNLNVLAAWLRADLYFTNYRPVPLTETFKVGPVIYDKSSNVLRELSQSQIVSGDTDHVLVLCQETVEEGNGVLVFCPTKSWCEKLSESIAKHFYTLGSEPKTRPRDGSSVMLDYDALKDVFEQLRSCQVGLDNVLGKTLRYGVAYHHAGLTYDERDIIEAGFRQGVIKVLVATSTLSSGVNLPARRVIIRTPMFHGKLLDGLVYKQMSGRAGRKGVDSQGESILICKTTERQKVRSLFEDDLKPVESCLVVKRSDEDEGNRIKRALLEIIASGVATTPADVQRYASCTFYVSSKAQKDGAITQNIIESTVGYLEKNEFISLRKKEDANRQSSSSSTESFVPTQLGQATLASSLSPDEALVVFADLRKARKCFVLENELHILYQVTPIYVQDTWPNLDWYQYLRLWERLPSHMKRVADLVGVEERFLNRATRGRPPTRSEAQRHALRVHKRFYVTLALHELVHEVPLDNVARKYGASRGMLQSLQSSAATFAGMVTVFCRKLGWHNLEMLLSQFQNRLSSGIERELCDVIRISALNAFRARVLYSVGYHTVAAIAAASPAEVEKHLRNATPFQSKKKSEGESEYELRRRMRAKCVWVKGGKALTEAEAAQSIVKEACGLLKEDASKLGITWKSGMTVSSGGKNTTTTNHVVSHGEDENGDNDEQEKDSKDFQPCKVSKTLKTTSLIKAKKSLTNDPHICSRNSPEKVDNLRDYNMATSVCNELATSSKGSTAIVAMCSNTSKATSACMAVTNSTVSYVAAVTSFAKQTGENLNTKEIVSEISPFPRSVSLAKEAPSIPSIQCSSMTNSSATSITRPTNTVSVAFNSAGITTQAVCNSPKSCTHATGRIANNEDTQFPHQNCRKAPRSPKTSTLRKPLFTTHGDTSKTAMPSNKKLPSNKELPSNTELTSDVRLTHTKEEGQETPRKKREDGLKRKHVVSKSPKDCNGPKMKLMDLGEPLGYQGDTKESIPDPRSPPRPKDNLDHQKDSFFTDCLDNFKIKGDVTPTKRKTRGIRLLESLPDSPRGTSRKAALLMVNNTKYSRTDEQDKQTMSSAINKLSNAAKTPEKNDPRNLRDHFDVVHTNCTVETNPQPEPKPGNHIPTSEFAPILFPGNPAFLETPTGEQFEIEDESPELIAACKSNDTAPALCKIPFIGLEYKSTSPNLVNTSPELFSELLFPEYESPLIGDESIEMQVDKMSESSGFENSNIDEEDKISVENNKVVKSKMPGVVHTPGKVDQPSDRQPEQDIASLMALCTPGMFDSEIRFSQVTQICFENNRCPEGDRHSSEICRQNPEQPAGSSVHTPKQCQATAERSSRSSGQSRRNSDSFSLRLSMSFESASDSDLSTRTLAAVAALEENERNSKDDKDKEIYPVINSQDNDGFQGDSNISFETMAAIEAMDDELRQVPASNKTARSYSTGEQGYIESGSACESRVSPDSRVPHEPSVSEKRFTEIKERSLLTKPVETTESKSRNSPQVAISDVKELPGKTSKKRSNLPFEIIDVAKDRSVFEKFMEGCKSNSFSFSVAVDKRQPASSTIGRKFNKEAKRLPARVKPGLAIETESVIVVGVAACWEKRQVHFLSLENVDDRSVVPWKERLDSLQCIMGFRVDNHVKTAFGMKDQYKVLSRACGIILKGELQDPKIAAWLLDPGAKEKNFVQMIEHFLTQDSNFLQGIIGGCGQAGFGLATQTSVPARERSCLNAVFTRMLMDHFRPMLEADGLWQAFTKIEMPVASCLARMELNGFGFSNNECEQIKHFLRAKLRALEQEAHRLAKRGFFLSSPEEVSRVLFLELKLPPDGHTEMSTSPGKAVRPTRGGRGRRVKYFSTSKAVLEKLVSLHPLPKVVLEWRRVNSALTKIVFPVQKEQVHCGPPLGMSRIFPTALTHTVTGRVTFVEPNLQNVPRDFDINLPTVIYDTPPMENLVGPRRKGKPTPRVYIPEDDFESSSPGPQFSVSLRSAFVPFPHGILLAADYSQLELRLIAHLSGDEKLAGFLNAGGDVFKMIAGELFHIAQDEVSDKQRQRAKHVCYGIIYGIGAKALGQTLGVDENEAGVFVDAFKARFTGVRGYLKRAVDECRKLGYVMSISGRRRYLPNIRSSNAASRSQAERQAVNTTVQGSAADLVKLAMANIDRRLCEEFTNCCRTHRQKSEDKPAQLAGKQVREKCRGANLVLQLHDELLFEVVEQDLSKVAAIVREEMENAMRLSVKFPVKMKCGQSWGTMSPIE